DTLNRHSLPPRRSSDLGDTVAVPWPRRSGFREVSRTRGDRVMADIARAWRTREQIEQEREAQAWASLRAERNRRLAETDWIMLRSEEHTSELQSRENLV